MESQNITTATIQYFPLNRLYLSDLNPRQEVAPDSIELLADSLALSGLLQNLSGLMDEQGKIGIVAGGRRLRAITRAVERDPDIIKTHPELAEIPVRVTNDTETARAWAMTENVAREDLHPADEIRAYGRMKEAGNSVSAIARTFGKTDAHVYRRLALASLPAPVIDALKAGEISLGVAACFTVSDDEDLTLTVLEEVKGRDISEQRLRKALQPEAISANDRRVMFIGLEAYEAAGGTLTRDLFSDTILLHKPDLVDRLFAEKLEDEAEKFAQGWKWFQTLEDSYFRYDLAQKMARIYRVEGVLTQEQMARHDELAEMECHGDLNAKLEAELETLLNIVRGDYTDEQRQHAGWFVCVDNQGELSCDGPYIRQEDRQAAIEAEVLTGFAAQSGHASAMNSEAKPQISNALRDDLNRIVAGAKQHAVLRDPDLLRDLLAYQLAHDLNWKKPLALATEAVANFPSTGNEGFSVDERLCQETPRDMFGKDLAKSFRAFRKKGADHIQAELVRALAALYRGGDEQLAAVIAKETAPNIRENWTPNAANFFSRVSGSYLDDLWRNLLDLSEQHPKATAFAKLKKGEKAKALQDLFSNPDTRKTLNLTNEQAQRIAEWLPEGMA